MQLASYAQIGVYSLMWKKHLRVVLPIAQGCLAAALMVWDFHNLRVIETMGMAWDTGAPIWPYQTASILLWAINTPPFILDVPLFWVFRLHSVPMRYSVLFPTILFWWWLVGRRIDFGLVPIRDYQYPRFFALALLAISVGFCYIGTRAALDEARWWFEYGQGFWTAQAILLLRSAGVAGWCFLLGCCAATAAFRFARMNRASARSSTARGS